MILPRCDAPEAVKLDLAPRCLARAPRWLPAVPETERSVVCVWAESARALLLSIWVNARLPRAACPLARSTCL